MKISLSHLSVGYTASQALVSDVNVELQSGQLHCLIGRNGIGKSTLLKTLTGFLPKLSGNLLLDGKGIETFTQQALARKISIVLTQKPDVQNLTVAEVIGLGIEPLRHRMIQTLSDGERQKVMIAKALAQGTPIILLDEPTAFLDFPSKAETFQLLRSMAHEKDKLIVLSTHDLELAVRFADCLLEVQEGSLHIVTAAEVRQEMQEIIGK